MNNFSFVKINSFLDKETVQSLMLRFDEIYNEEVYKINQENIRELKYADIIKEPKFHNLYNRINKKIIEISSFRDLKISKLWLVYSEATKENRRYLPYVPHIDKLRYLKAMVYLNDVNLNNGPIHLAKAKNNITIETIRKNLQSDYKDKGANVVNEKMFQGSLNPITGKAGDVIFFDTNTPHKAGVVKEGFDRKVLRFDFERPCFNLKPSMLNNIMTTITKKLKKDI